MTPMANELVQTSQKCALTADINLEHVVLRMQAKRGPVSKYFLSRVFSHQIRNVLLHTVEDKGIVLIPLLASTR
jgi:hypothetical protein